MRSLPWVAVALCLSPSFAFADKPAGPLDLETESLRPGLVAEYRSLIDPDAVIHRVEPKPAFYLAHSSPHPRIPPGPFELVWIGIIHLQDPSPISFSTFVGGELAMQVDGMTVLRGRGESDASELKPLAALAREPGMYRISIHFRSLANAPARLQLMWEGKSFAREPIPAWRFHHVAADETPALRQAEVEGRGRVAVGRYGCARCHATTLPAVTDPPPGPSLADVGRRVSRAWLVNWLADPSKVRPEAQMPALFATDRTGYAERWLIADYLTRDSAEKREERAVPGDHRAGRLAFLNLGCATCHFVPDGPRSEQPDLERITFTGLGDRMRADDLVTFLGNPHGRYPDGRMPRVPVTPDQARHIAAYLLLWAKPSAPPAADAPSAGEIQQVFVRLGVRDRSAAAVALLRTNGCNSCHPGLGPTLPLDVPVKSAGGCLIGKSSPRFTMDASARSALTAYLAVAGREKHLSPFTARQERLARAGCVRCHQRDSDRPPPIEQVGSTLGGGFLQEIPFQRTPRLTFPHQKYTRSHLVATVREGIAGLRQPNYSYRMPAFGPDAEVLVQALAEADGELPAAADPPDRPVADPTVGTLTGPQMIGSQGYSCISCHVWNGRLFVPADPVAIGPDLTRLSGRIRRDWFDRFLEGPQRFCPGTPMPTIFERGKRALLPSVLDGDPAKQREALWSYFAQGKTAPEPKPVPPLPIEAPAPGSVLVAQIPIRLPEGGVVESICVLTADHDLLIYDLAAGAPHSFRSGAQITRTVQGRLRQFHAVGSTPPINLAIEPGWQLVRQGKKESPTERILEGYDRLPDGVRLRWRLRYTGVAVTVEETLQIQRTGSKGLVIREWRLNGVPPDAGVTLDYRRVNGDTRQGFPWAAGMKFADELPPAKPAPPWKDKPTPDQTPVEGSLERPGYRAVAYPRPKTASGEDRIMPVALAAHPKDGRVFVASLKTGEIFVLRDPDDTGKSARFENYTNGLFQDALSMLAEDDALYVLHRRNLTRIPHASGVAERFERVTALPQAVADAYDYGYGLVRDKSGGFMFTYAAYGNAKMAGAGGALSLVPGKPPREMAFGFRNPLGWCVGPEREVFFTDNQGDWVATNKLCHIVEGRYYGWPNSTQKQHTTKPMGKPVIWVPYGWARSINGVAYDNSGGKFGPFAGQFFMAELMFGGAVIRANVEKINGEYQGACFPFWGKGLLGPVSLAFDPKGRLFVGGITEPGWMAQPDRGALFRIDFTGPTPFEMQSIHALPHGFRIVFTAPVDRTTAANPDSYRLEHYRYEYTGAYGSPELDRTAVAVESATVAADGRSVELRTATLVKDRVYLVNGRGVRSAEAKPLVNPTGAYTLNEIPADAK
jgi:glucose/arabinose dehydrogenase/mono/diheme cytochrome c family protein